MNAQMVDIFLKKDKSTLEVSIVSDSNMQLNMGLYSTHVYGVENSKPSGPLQN